MSGCRNSFTVVGSHQLGAWPAASIRTHLFYTYTVTYLQHTREVTVKSYAYMQDNSVRQVQWQQDLLQDKDSSTHSTTVWRKAASFTNIQKHLIGLFRTVTELTVPMLYRLESSKRQPCLPHLTPAEHRKLFPGSADLFPSTELLLPPDAGSGACKH